jgi:hypothetical protein
MMHFIDRTVDGELMAELRDVGLLDPALIERIDMALDRPETGTLTEFLLGGADFVAENAWLFWLIRRHGCQRFGPVGWRPEAEPWAREGPPADGNLPYRTCPDAGCLVAVLRPDLLAATARRWPGPLHRAAATLREMRALHSAWKDRLVQPWA